MLAFSGDSEVLGRKIWRFLSRAHQNKCRNAFPSRKFFCSRQEPWLPGRCLYSVVFWGGVWWSLLPRSLVGSVPACAHQLALSLDPRNPCRGSAGLRWQMEQADPLSLRMPPPQAAHGHRPLPVTTLTPSVTLGGRERSLGAPARMCCCVCVRSVRQPSHTHANTCAGRRHPHPQPACCISASAPSKF